MSLRVALAAACTALVLILGPGAAQATPGPVIPTAVTVDLGKLTTTPTGATLILLGHVTSTNPKCLDNRTVKIKFYGSGGSNETLADIARTGKNGYWGASGEYSGFGDASVFVARKSIGSRKHPRFCGTAFLPSISG